MKHLTGVYLTDGISKSGVRFSIGALEDALWQGYGRCVPSNIEHDIHRPLGVTRISALFLSHESTYLLGNTSLPETTEENRWMMATRTDYLNEKMIERVLRYSQEFNKEVSNLGLMKDECRMMSNGIVLYGYDSIVLDAFPFLRGEIDSDGLIYLSNLLQNFEYKGDGVFASKKNNLSVLVHPFLRRSLSRYNCFNKDFLKELFDSNTEETPVRIRVDLDYVGYTPSFKETQEFDYWYGPEYTDDISKIKEGVAAYDTNKTEYLFNQIKKTEFVWQDKDGKRQFEMEEVTDVEAPTLSEGTYACRYLHSFYDTTTGMFDHFDGAIRSYDLEAICRRLENPITAMGHTAGYTKVFRIDGPLPIRKWKSLITHYLRGNQDIYRYFGENVPSVAQKQQPVNPLSKYVPFVPKKGDGVRLLYSYHTKGEEGVERLYRDFDTCQLMEGIVETTDLMAVDLAKCIRRCGGEMDYPNCRYISYRDNFHDLPEIFHGGNNPASAIEKTLEGIKMLLKGLDSNGIEDSISFCLSWNLDDRKVKVSFMGAVPDMLAWVSSLGEIQTGREELKKWLETQAQYYKKNGQDTPSPINASYIHDNGIFYHRRRLVQKDAELKELYYNDRKELCANIDFNDSQKELLELMDKGVISPSMFVVVDKLLCNGNEDYLTHDEIACLNEIECQPTIHFMSLVWTSNKNGLRELLIA